MLPFLMRRDNEHTCDELRLMASRYCAANETCRQQARQKLTSWGATHDEAEEIADWLQSEGYINEERYAKTYAESKVRYQHWGRKKIEYQLRGKGIDNAIIHQALRDIDENVYMQVLTDTATAKARTMHNGSDEQRNKMISFLTSRGFEYELIITTLDNMTITKNEI